MLGMRFVVVPAILFAVLGAGVSGCKTRAYNTEDSQTEAFPKYAAISDAALGEFRAVFSHLPANAQEGKAMIARAFKTVENEAAAKEGHTMVAFWQAVRRSPEIFDNFILLKAFKPESRLAIATFMEHSTTRAAKAMQALRGVSARNAAMYEGWMNGHMQSMTELYFGYLVQRGVSNSDAVNLAARSAFGSEAYLNASIVKGAKHLQTKGGIPAGELLAIDDAARQMADEAKIPTHIQDELLGVRGDNNLSKLFVGFMNDLESMSAKIASMDEKVVKGQVSKLGAAFDALKLKASTTYRNLMACACVESAKIYALTAVVGTAVSVAVYEKYKTQVDASVDEAKKNFENDYKKNKNFNKSIYKLDVSTNSEMAYFKPQTEAAIAQFIKAAVMIENNNYQNGAALTEDLRTQLRL